MVRNRYLRILRKRKQASTSEKEKASFHVARSLPGQRDTANPPAVAPVDSEDKATSAAEGSETAAASAPRAQNSTPCLPKETAGPLDMSKLPPGWCRLMNYGRLRGYRGPEGQRARALGEVCVSFQQHAEYPGLALYSHRSPLMPHGS